MNLFKKVRKELGEVLTALCSLTFYIIIIVRATMISFAFVSQLLTGLIASYVLGLFFSKVKLKMSQNASRAVLITFFLSIFYKDALFSIFSLVLLLIALHSLHYAKKENKTKILLGVLTGVASTALSLAFVLMLF